MSDTGLEMVALQIEETPTVVVPLVGTLVDLREPVEVAQALEDIQDLKRQLDEVRGLLEGVLRLEAQRQGTKTLHLGTVDAVISGGSRPEYDAELLRYGLEMAGLPEDRLAEVVVEVVSYKVDGRVLRQLAGANEDYERAIVQATARVETPWRVSLKKSTRWERGTKMSETPGTMSAEDRRAALEAELATIQEQERAAEAERRAAEQAELEAKMDPEQREQKAEIERRAKEQLDREFPPAWMPQKAGSTHPDEIIGLVLRIDPRVGPSATFGTYSAVVEVRTTAGAEWTVWCNEQGALYSQLTRLRVQPGEVIAVRYKGMKESQANPGQSYHDFRMVRVDDDDEPSAPVDYEALERARVQPELEAAAAAVPGSTAPPDDDIPFTKTSYSNWM